MSDLWYKQGTALLNEMNETALPENAVAIWFLGQESLVVKHGSTIVYIDPYLTEYPKRKYQPPFRPDEVNNATWVFGTHHHLDHIDPNTVGPMAQASPQAQFVVPAPHVHMLTKVGIADNRIHPARADERLHLPGFSVTPIKAAHEQFETDDAGNHLYLGYVFQFGPITLYHAGDTVEFPELVDLLRPHQIDVACLPINGRDWQRGRRNVLGNLNFREAVNVGVEAGADLIIPLHYDLFQGNQENPAFFVDYLYRTYPAQKFHIMAPGERFVYFK